MLKWSDKAIGVTHPTTATFLTEGGISGQIDEIYANQKIQPNQNVHTQVKTNAACFS